MAKPKLTLTTGTAPVEGGAIGTYLISLDQAAPAGGLTINFNTLGSTATINADYNFAIGAGITAITGNSFTIAEGASTAVLNLVANADAILDPNETVVLNLTTGVDYQLAASSSLFAPKVDYATGTNPYSVTTGDFNGDGKLDMAVANWDANTVSVLLGTGIGTFAAKVDYTTGAYSSFVTTGDFNGDGKLDMAVINLRGNTVSVLLGTGSGTFAAKVDYATGTQPYSVTTGDFNSDGKLDMAVTNIYDNTVSVLLRNAVNTGFDAKVDIAETGAYFVTTGDFNGDGKIDMAVANASSNLNTVSVLLGTGSGTFVAKVDYATGTTPGDVATGDFNGDGKLDMVAANFDANTVSVLLGTGSGIFAAKVDYATGSKPGSVMTGDFNGDGKLDIAVANWNANTVSMLLGTGSGTFAAKVDYATGTAPNSVTSGDFNGDGKLDMAVANVDAGTVSVLLNNASPSANLTITDTPQNHAPILTTPAEINYTDTAFVDDFATVVGSLSASDIDVGTVLTYGIVGGTTGSIADTVVAHNAYGELTVNTITGAYHFAPDSAAIEPLKANASDSFTVTVSDGQLTDSKSLAITIVQKGITESIGNDTLTGTCGDNNFNGLEGNDIIVGGAGNDTINGGSGADTMTGGSGNDTYYVDNVGDLVKENSSKDDDYHHDQGGAVKENSSKDDDRHHDQGGAVKENSSKDDDHHHEQSGVDTVYSSISYTLTANVENLSLAGTKAINGTGNELDNQLTGNDANNILRGGDGNDILTGGNGADILVGGHNQDTYKLAETTATTDTLQIAKGDSLITGYDKAFGFALGTGIISTAGVDKLDLTSTHIAADADAVNGSNAGNIKSHHINDGIISFDDINHYANPLDITHTNLDHVFSYLQTNIKGYDTVAFISEGNTFVFQDGGTTDALVELVGVTALAVNTTGLVAGAVWIV